MARQFITIEGYCDLQGVTVSRERFIKYLVEEMIVDLSYLDEKYDEFRESERNG